MDRLSQLAAVIAIAAGAGLYSFSRHIDPPIRPGTSDQIRWSVSDGEHQMAAATGGWGTAFMTLGVLGLVVPWINVWMRNERSGVSRAY